MSIFVPGTNLIHCVGPLWEGFHKSRKCSRNTYPGSCITKYASTRRIIGILREDRSQFPSKPNVWYSLHGGVRPFHPKSTYPHSINLRTVCGAHLVTYHADAGVPETVVVHRVASRLEMSDSKVYEPPSRRARLGMRLRTSLPQYRGSSLIRNSTSS